MMNKFETLILIFILAVGCTQTIYVSNNQIEFSKEMEKDIMFLDSIYSPLKRPENVFITYCSDGDSSVLEPMAGYIIKNVDFEKQDTIYVCTLTPLDFVPPKGNKNILFLHFQPKYFIADLDCDSTNLVIATELPVLDDLVLNLNILNNTQLSFFTGMHYLPFEQNVYGSITLKQEEKEVYKVISKFIFKFDDGRWRKLNGEFSILTIDRLKIKE